MGNSKASVTSPSGSKRLTAPERREQIIASAQRVFIAHGLAGARTRDIAAEAGINEALLYRHFESKEALFDEAVLEPLQQAVARLASVASDPPADTSSSREEMLERTQLFIADLAEVMRDVAPLLGVMMFSGQDAAADHYAAIMAPVFKEVGDVVRANLGWWDHRDFDVDRLVRFIVGALWFEATSARIDRRSIDTQPLADELAAMIILGLASRP